MKQQLILSIIIFSVLLLLVTIGMSQQDDFIKNANKTYDKLLKERPRRTLEENKLGDALFEILRFYEHADTSADNRNMISGLLERSKTLALDSKGLMNVIIILKSPKDTGNVNAIISSMNGEIQAHGVTTILGCKIHPLDMRKIISEPAVLRIEPRRNPRNNVITEGYTQLKVDLAHQNYGVTGNGVTVGVISNGIDHISDVQQATELPMEGSGFTKIKSGSGDEGTAMLEIVHDIAPNANLVFTSGLDYVDLSHAIQRLSRS